LVSHESICRARDKIKVPAPVRIGDKILQNLLNLDVDIIATKNVEKI